MRAISCSMVALALAMLGAGPGPDEAATKVDLEGRWKVVVLAFGDDEFLILDVKAGQDGPRATVVDAQAFLQNPQVAKLAREGGTVTLGLKQGGADLTFVGTRDARAADPAGARFLGTFQFRGATYPARLERTDAAKVGALSRTDAIPQGVAAAQRQPDPKARVEALRTVVREAKGHPAAASAYAALLQGAEAAGLTQEEVRGLVADWRAEAQPYGPSWAGEVQSNALTALAGKKAYAALTLELAQEADRALGESVPLERRAAVARVLADAARAAGRDELAATVATKADQLEARLDDEYRATVPPFRPEPVAARADGKGDRVVLMELFTGAQCPPCVAADVAFDALIHSYRPTELVTLQYHLHIPGPDPLTGPAALARGDYYDVHSTPTTLFNGQPEARGGGGMANAEAKYHQYREVIAGRLDGKKAATIALTNGSAGSVAVGGRSSMTSIAMVRSGWSRSTL